MKTKLSRKEAKEKIEEFFGRENFAPEEALKIKKLAMKFNIKLKEKRKKFCKKCFSKIRGKIRVTKNYKNVVCGKCEFRNRFKVI